MAKNSKPPEPPAVTLAKLLAPGTTKTSDFGNRFHPIYHTNKLHAGTDFGGKIGTPIMVAGPGRVIFSGTQKGYGNIVIIDHGDGITTRYAHQSKLGVKKGDTVKAGQIIGAVGNTGGSTGPHLHFEVREKGKPMNPLTYDVRKIGANFAGAPAPQPKVVQVPPIPSAAPQPNFAYIPPIRTTASPSIPPLDPTQQAPVPAPALSPMAPLPQADFTPVQLDPNLENKRLEVERRPIPDVTSPIEAPAIRSADDAVADLRKSIAMLPETPPKKGLFDGVGQALGDAGRQVQEFGKGVFVDAANAALTQARTEAQTPAALRVPRFFADTTLGAGLEGAKLINGIWDLQGVPDGIRIPTGGLQDYIDQNAPVAGFLGAMAPYALGEGAVLQGVKAIPKAARLVDLATATAPRRVLSGAGVNAIEGGLVDPGEAGPQGRLANMALAGGLGALVHGGIEGGPVVANIPEQVRYQKWLYDHIPEGGVPNRVKTPEPIQVSAPSVKPFLKMVPEEVNHPGGQPAFYANKREVAKAWNKLDEAHGWEYGKTTGATIQQLNDGRFVIHEGQPKPIESSDFQYNQKQDSPYDTGVSTDAGNTTTGPEPATVQGETTGATPKAIEPQPAQPQAPEVAAANQGPQGQPVRPAWVKQAKPKYDPANIMYEAGVRGTELGDSLAHDTFRELGLEVKRGPKGFKVNLGGQDIWFDRGQTLNSVIKDANAIFRNKGKKITAEEVLSKKALKTGLNPLKNDRVGEITPDSTPDATAGMFSVADRQADNAVKDLAQGFDQEGTAIENRAYDLLDEIKNADSMDTLHSKLDEAYGDQYAPMGDDYYHAVNTYYDQAKKRLEPPATNPIDPPLVKPDAPITTAPIDEPMVQQGAGGSGIQTEITQAQQAKVEAGKAMTPEMAAPTPEATTKAVEQAFSDGAVITTTDGADVFTGNNPGKLQAAIEQTQKGTKAEGGKILLGFNEARDLIREWLPDKMPFFDAFWQAGAQGKQLVINYRERVRGWASGTVDDHITQWANGKGGSVELFASRNQAATAAQAYKRINPTFTVSEPQPVRVQTKNGERIKWKVDAVGDREIDPFAVAMQMRDGEPYFYLMSYNYGSSKAGNVRSYRLSRGIENIEGFKASQIGADHPYQSEIVRREKLFQEAKREMIEGFPGTTGSDILGYLENDQLAKAQATFDKAVKQLTPEQFERIERAFNTWCGL